MTDGPVDSAGEAALDLKKRARRRLVGASTLALAAAIVLPMVMDREPRPPAQDIQVRIPNQDGTGFTSRIVPGKATSTPLPPAEAKPEATSKLAAKAEPAKAEAPKPDAKVETKAEAKSEAKPESKPEAKAEPKPADKPAADKPAKLVEKPAEKAAEKPAEKVADKPKPADKPAEKAVERKDDMRAAAALAGGGGDHQWVVQLGAYKEAGNVKLLLGKIKQLGLPAYTEAFDSPQGPRTRVRAGPFPNKDAAEKAQARIKIIGVDGPVAPK